MTDKTGILTFNGKPLVDLKSQLKFSVSEDQCEKGARKNGELCPGALGIKSTCKLNNKKCLKAEVHRAVVYMDFGGNIAYRGYLSSSLRREVISQDKGGHFDPGKYIIVPPPDAEQKRRGRAHSKRPRNHARPYRTKRSKPKLIVGIRKLALSSKNVGYV